MKENDLESLFAPQSIAIVGASNKKGKIGKIISDNILKLGYKGKIYLVNPSYKMLGFKRCYSSLSSINKQVDVAIICVPAKFVNDVVVNGSKNVKNFVVISAGFSENGSEGAKREKELLSLAKKHNINILGPNCLGFIVPSLKLNASFANGMPQAGNIAFISQSGALAVALMDKAKEENLGFSNIISVGNQMQLGEIELLEYLAEDKKTKVIGMYLEGIKDGKKFIEKAGKISLKKPIVILKAGKTEKSQQAISSHTGALAGSDEIASVAFENSGIIRADSLDNFFDLLKLISFTDAPKNNKSIAITNAGGAGVLATDAFKNKEIVLAELDERIKNNLKQNLPEEASVQNPIDLLGDAKEDRYEKILNILGKEKAGSAICLLTPQEQTPVKKVSEVIIAAREKNKISLVTVFIGGEKIRQSVAYLEKNNIPNFSSPEDAICALNQYYKWDVYRQSKNAKEKMEIMSERKKQVAEIISKAQMQNRKALFFGEAAEIMQKYGIKCSEFWEVSLPSDISENIKYPAALKVDSDKILHKSDKQALILDIKNKEELESVVKKLQENFPGEKLIVQPMGDKQTEIILGIKRDSVFGPVIVYGLGGIYTEIFKMVDFLIPPMSRNRMKESVLKGKIGFLFKGVRGKAAYDIDEFSEIIESLMEFSLENEEVKEFDINPLLIYNDERKACAIDVKIII